MKLSEELKWRGFVHQTTLKDLSDLDAKKITFYHGFDASADSQTIGNLAGMMLDRLFMRHGHQGVILAGGATSLIGDPGGKDEERPLQEEQAIAQNITKAEEQLQKVFSGYKFDLVNNLDWMRSLTVIDYLRRYGKHFSVTPLIQRDYISNRLGEGSSGISYAEFSYTILQGIDYLQLFEKKNVTLQLGGSDQWGNCLSGVELIRKVHGKDVHVLTLPLIINKVSGKKFGKTEDGAIWLDPIKTTPFHFYQFWINVDDGAVEDYLKIYTELTKGTIESLMAEFEKNKATRKAQKVLAYEVTKIVHGEVQANKQRHISDVLFSGEGVGNLDGDELAIIRKEYPSQKCSPGTPIIDVLVGAGLASSNSEARRLRDGSAIYVNNQTFTKDHLESRDFQNGKLLLRRGKAFKDSALVELK